MHTEHVQCRLLELHIAVSMWCLEVQGCDIKRGMCYSGIQCIQDSLNLNLKCFLDLQDFGVFLYPNVCHELFWIKNWSQKVSVQHCHFQLLNQTIQAGRDGVCLTFAWSAELYREVLQERLYMSLPKACCAHSELLSCLPPALK